MALDYISNLRRELTGKAESADYGTPDQDETSFGWGNVLVSQKGCIIARHQRAGITIKPIFRRAGFRPRVDAASIYGEWSVRSTRAEERLCNICGSYERGKEKGKFVVFLVDNYEAKAPSLHFHSSRQHLPNLDNLELTKTTYLKAVQTLRARYLALREQQEIRFEPSPEILPTLRGEAVERFHDLIDKQLMGGISDEERTELNRLEFAFRESEARDEREQALREEWGRRLDRAITGLGEINQKLGMLLSSGR